MSDFTLAVATPDIYPTLIPDLAAILKACVDGGAGVHFLAPLAIGRAVAFWRDTENAIRAGDRRLYYATRAGRVVGTVQLVLGQPENGPHRAEVSKMLVHPDARRGGIARALLAFAETDARREGKTLLFLDSVPDGAPEALYRGAGFRRIGLIPDFAVYADGSRTSTAILYKHLDRPAVTVRRAAADAPEVRALIAAQVEALARVVVASNRPRYDPAANPDPRAAIFVAEIDGVPVGCGALKPVDATTAEIKRLYAAPDARGVGAALIEALETHARRHGFSTMLIETRTANRRAVSFYIAQGYLPCPAYGEYIGRTDAICFDKRL
jgi:GNAT superfamily N-acetyltransferase